MRLSRFLVLVPLFVLCFTPTVACMAAGAPNPAEVEKMKAALPEKATVAPQKERKILIIDKCQGFVHSSVPLATETFKLLGEKTGAYTSDVTDDLAAFTTENLARYDAILFNNTTTLKLTDEQKQALLDFVHGGKGIIGCHAATDNFYDWPEGAAMMGGLFDGHPWNAGREWAIKIDEPDHPLNRAFENTGFLIDDEIYKFKAPYSRDRLRILVSLDMEEGRNVPGRADGDNAISWIQRVGEGRVFYCSFGHQHPVFFTPSILGHYLDGIQYALGDLECDDRPSNALETKPVPALCPKSE